MEIIHSMMLDTLRSFNYEHLNPRLQDVSRNFAALAQKMYDDLPYDIETLMGLRKLLEAKDCFVRAALHLGDTNG